MVPVVEPELPVPVPVLSVVPVLVPVVEPVVPAPVVSAPRVRVAPPGFEVEPALLRFAQLVTSIGASARAAVKASDRVNFIVIGGFAARKQV